jgi:hypothetical protein
VQPGPEAASADRFFAWLHEQESGATGLRSMPNKQGEPAWWAADLFGEEAGLFV